jgi:hypothetical protein
MSSYILPPAFDLVFSDELTVALRTVTSAPSVAAVYEYLRDATTGEVYEIDMHGQGRTVDGSLDYPAVIYTDRKWVFADNGMRARLTKSDGMTSADRMAEFFSA